MEKWLKRLQEKEKNLTSERRNWHSNRRKYPFDIPFIKFPKVEEKVRKTRGMSLGSVSNKHNVIGDEDELEKLMKHTGCLELHYKVQECIAETRDWRKCQNEVQNFRKCMEAYKAKQGQL